MVGLLQSSNDASSLKTKGHVDVDQVPQPVPARVGLRGTNVSIQRQIKDTQWPKEVSVDKVVQSAWAILLFWHGESAEVTFDIAAPAPIGDSIDGYTSATVHAAVDGDITLSTLQHHLSVSQQADTPTTQSVISEAAETTWQSQSLLVVQPAPEAGDSSASHQRSAFGGNMYPINLHCEWRETSLLAGLTFDKTLVSEQLASQIAARFEHILRQACRADMATTKINDFDAMTAEDLHQIWTWNATPPEEAQGSVNDVFAQSVSLYPHETAISAWDGQMTYTQWDRVSTQLAHHLIHRGVRPGQVVPLIFEKSLWVPVSQYAVIKAGAASVVIDPSQTKERIKTMIDIVEAGLVLCGTSTAAMVSSITKDEPFVVKKETVSEIPREYSSDAGAFGRIQFPQVKPSDLLYVVFTSGTTGNPKGAAITHSNFTSAIKHQNEVLNFRPGARVAGFCSYAFDVSWSDFVHTLAAGACLCVPSEDDRKHDFTEFMIRNDITFVHLTPSVAAILDLDKVPTLETVALIGEVVDFDKLPQLDNIETAIITYGPAECTVTTTGATRRGAATTKATIGWALGSTTWVADPSKDSLTPVGLIGELLLEGPLVGAGYMNNPEKTSAAFINDPSWLLRGSASLEGRRGRLYRTGDLVRYNPDGELIYIGRKDTQVKIHGQRTELGDVEHHVCRVLHSVRDVVADVVAEVVTPTATQRPMLVAFLLMPTTQESQLSTAARPVIKLLDTYLPEQVPAHMVPSLYVPMTDIPRGLTGKTDRRALREIGAKLDQKSLASVHGIDAVLHVEPTTEAERQLRELWASVLNLRESDIGTQDNFVRLGGDSIAAIRLATDLRRRGILLTVQDTFKHPQLSEMAKLISQQDEVAVSAAASIEAVPPFSLMKPEIDREDARRQVAELCSASGSAHVEASQVDDIFPCTALQEGMLAMTALSSGGKYVNHQIAELKSEVDPRKLKEAWHRVSERASVLRTRIVYLPGQGLVQVVLQEALAWQTFSSWDEYNKYNTDHTLENSEESQTETAMVMGLGTPLSRFALIHDGPTGKRFLVLTQHHATHDGWSVPLLQKEVEKAYNVDAPDVQLSSVPIQGFVKYVMQQQQDPQGVEFWKQQFADIEASPFPALPSQSYEPKPDKVISHTIDHVRWPTCGVTPSSALRTAWATLISWYIDSPDVAFGAVVSGRQASVPGIEDVAGPTIATVPLRIVVKGTVDELLHQVQTQAMDMVPYEQYGLQNIRQIGKDAQYACDFQTLLLIHPATSSNKDNISDSPVFQADLTDQETGTASENSYALMLSCQTSESRLDMQLSFDSAVVKDEAAVRILQQVEHILDQIASLDGPSTDIANLSRVSERDLLDIWGWNATVPDTVEDCVHHVFAQRVTETPEAPAVCAWDGELTYAELDHFSTMLANRIVSSGLGVGPGSIVPLCFEKSMWVPVAVLAVMKLGAASVALDTTLPPSRLENIVSQLSAKVILSSRSCESLAGEITDAPTIQVGGDDWSQLDQLFPLEPIAHMPTVSPSAPLYIVFTSGSTGAPKGATVTHANFCSAIRHHQHELGFDSSSRVFDYTSYAFDVAWSNILHTLTVGGCLCIPSEDERSADISGSIKRLRANFVHLTPTVGRLLEPAELTALKSVLFIGEALKASDVAHWETSGAEIYNTYGPAECTVTSTVEKIQKGQPSEKSGDPSIGRGIGAVAWVVQPRAPEKLAAIGTVGELWLEGPIVGAGYLDNPDKTASAFITDPKWLLEGVPGRVAGRHGRLYRTGDVVYYHPDGSLGFVGRNDTQVKINGQRMELGEVEHHVRQILPSTLVPQVVVDVIIPDASQQKTLAVFMVMSDDGLNKSEATKQLSEEAATMVENLRTELSRLLPSYMVPSAYIPIPVAQLPMTATGKTDRRRIREEWGRTYVLPRSSSPSNTLASDAVLSSTETTLQKLWATLLGIQPEIIAASHSFPDIGGDSIKTMSLSMALRKEFDVNIGVPRLVQQRISLRELAALIDTLQRGQSGDDIPTNLTPNDLEQEIKALVGKIEQGRPAAAQSTVFLTGSTGFLGTQILRSILTKRTFDRVILLVRSLKQQGGLERVVSTAKIAGWWQDSFTPAIEVWEGDLAAQNLGLDESQWDALCGRPSIHGTVEAIIHNGAVVHWTTHYDGLKNVNVGSTVQLLTSAMTSPFLKNFVYVSGGLITDSRTWTEEETNMSNGYDQTKYVSERLVSAAATQFRKPETTFSVVKPGQIIGDVYTGVASADDFLWRVVMGAVRLGAHPVDSETSWLSVSDVRHVTDSIEWSAGGRTGKNHFVHIKKGVWVKDFWAAVQDQLQLPLRPVSWDEWTELAKQDMVQYQEKHPLWPVQMFLGALGAELEVTEQESYEGSMQEVLAAVRKNVKYLQSKGFLNATGGIGAREGVITRTRNVPAVGSNGAGV